MRRRRKGGGGEGGEVFVLCFGSYGASPIGGIKIPLGPDEKTPPNARCAPVLLARVGGWVAGGRAGAGSLFLFLSLSYPAPPPPPPPLPPPPFSPPLPPPPFLSFLS